MDSVIFVKSGSRGFPCVFCAFRNTGGVLGLLEDFTLFVADWVLLDWKYPNASFLRNKLVALSEWISTYMLREWEYNCVA